MILDKEFDRDLVTYAFRYALTRYSYVPGLMQDKLDEIWTQLQDYDQQGILQEIKQHLDRASYCEVKDYNATETLDGWRCWREKKLTEMGKL